MTRVVIFVSAALFVALADRLIARLRTNREPLLPLERVALAAAGGGALWIASLWILALTHTFGRTGLIVRTMVVVVALLPLAGEGARRADEGRAKFHAARLLPFLPLAIWLAFILWRGAIVPPLTHDALAYHLPKATLLVRAGGYEWLGSLHPLIRWLPMNYELLLAESIAWSGSDQTTEWVSALFYLFFIAGAGALAERWWGRSQAAVATAMLCAAAIPVALLHSGADKNDLMVNALLIAMMVAIGRWLTTSERIPLLIGVLAAAAAIGTKPQAGMLALCFAPIIVWRLRRDPRTLAAVIAVAIGAFFLLGGVVYATNWLHDGSPFGTKLENEQSIGIVPFGVWKTLWQGPYVLLAAPFSRSPWFLNVPWEARPWFWRRYEIYFSHLGMIFSLCAMAWPLALIARSIRRDGNARERVIVTVAALVTFLSILPVSFRPHGMYAISLPRYVLFLAPVIFGWTVVPLARRLERMSAPVAAVWLGVLSVFFAAQAWEYGRNDTFVPRKYLEYVRSHPGTRVVAFEPNRAASVADRAAGPREKIALDAGFGTWIQPAFGRDLKRPVQFIQPGAGPPVIDPDVKWVAVDRMFRTVWGHPDFVDLSQAGEYLTRGTPGPEDLRVIEFLSRDPHFQTVFYNRRTIQALFRRVR